MRSESSLGDQPCKKLMEHMSSSRSARPLMLICEQMRRPSFYLQMVRVPFSRMPCSQHTAPVGCRSRIFVLLRLCEPSCPPCGFFYGAHFQRPAGWLRIEFVSKWRAGAVCRTVTRFGHCQWPETLSRGVVAVPGGLESFCCGVTTSHTRC